MYSYVAYLYSSYGTMLYVPLSKLVHCTQRGRVVGTKVLGSRYQYQFAMVM